MKIYLDIDGVLLTRKQEIPENIDMFLDFVTKNFDCYWLTTHCRTGENKTLNYLSNFYSDELIDKIKDIKPINWVSKKTEAIDFNSNFLWLDDYPFQSEKEDLIKYNRLENLIVVNLNTDNELVSVIDVIKSKI